MRIAAINMYSDGSTGKIMLQVAELARKSGHEVVTYSTHSAAGHFSKLPEPPEGHKYYGNFAENCLHYIIGNVFGFNGCFSTVGTYKLIKELKKQKIDILHLHNLHRYCINLPVLFRFIKKNNIKVIWTLHDCWAFTGHCPHFDMAGCDKWKSQCFSCPKHRSYPSSYFDDSRFMYKIKKNMFSEVENLTLVTPSEWLGNLAKQSFLKDKPVKVINNGVDLNVFKTVKSDFRKKYQCEDKFIILGVAFAWGKSKGLDVFIELSKRLPNNYQIVLIGTDEKIDDLLPDNIISIHRTGSREKLAEIYSSADLFVNPTREEVFGLVNIEALACSTPVLTFRTGGCPECIDETCGSVVEKNDIDAMEKEIIRIAQSKPFSQDSCVERAKLFDINKKYQEYIDLYNSVSQKEK